MQIGTGGRVSDLHKGAFWIYGLTALVMREPMSNWIRHTTAAGLGDGQVQLEALRLILVLTLMARLFLNSGLYFDEVYLRPESLSRFPRRSYPIDFLAGLLQVLLVVAASTIVNLHARVGGEFAPYTIYVALLLLFDSLWWAASAVLRFSTVPVVARSARFNAISLAVCAAAWTLARWARLDPAAADQTAFLLLLALTLYDVSTLVGGYDQPA